MVMGPLCTHSLSEPLALTLASQWTLQTAKRDLPLKNVYWYKTAKIEECIELVKVFYITNVSHLKLE